VHMTLPQSLQTSAVCLHDKPQMRHWGGHGGALGHLWDWLQVWKVQFLSMMGFLGVGGASTLGMSLLIPGEDCVDRLGVLGVEGLFTFFCLLLVRVEGGDTGLTIKTFDTSTFLTGVRIALRMEGGFRTVVEWETYAISINMAEVLQLLVGSRCPIR